jgi:hypothetical protein
VVTTALRLARLRGVTTCIPIDVSEARDWLHWFREAIRRGEVTARDGVVARIEEAIGALDALVRHSPATPGARGPVTPGPRREPDAVLVARERLGQRLDALRRGDQTASSAYKARLEGAIAALDALLGEPPSTTGVKGASPLRGG